MTRFFAFLLTTVTLLAGIGHARAQGYDVMRDGFFGGGGSYGGGSSPIQRTAVNFASNYAPGTIFIDTAERRLYLVLANGQATWQLSVPKPVTATITVKSATGVQVYSGTRPLNTGTQAMGWDGKDASGLQWPDGNYTISVTAQDASGQPVAVPTAIEAVVDSADLTKTPPVLSIAGQDYTVDKIKRAISWNCGSRA